MSISFNKRTVIQLIRFAKEIAKSDSATLYNSLTTSSETRLDSKIPLKPKEKDITTVIKVTASFKSLSVSLHTHGKSLAQASINNLGVSVKVRSDTTLSVSGALGSIAVIDTRSSAKLPQILSIPGKCKIVSIM
jgi:hypothetical protein